MTIGPESIVKTAWGTVKVDTARVINGEVHIKTYLTTDTSASEPAGWWREALIARYAESMYGRIVGIPDSVIRVLTRGPHPSTIAYTVGDLTMARVFEPAGLTNVSDWQAVLDSVEKALAARVEPAPAQGGVEALASERDALLEELGKVILACPMRPDMRTSPASVGVRKLRDEYERLAALATPVAPQSGGVDVSRTVVANIIDPHSFCDIPFTDDPVFLDMVEQSKQDALRKADRILSALRASQQAAEWRPTHRHVKTGGEYMLLGVGRMQSEHWRGDFMQCDGEYSRQKVDMREVAIYRSHDGQMWARPVEEFNDGRFEPIQQAADEKGGDFDDSALAQDDK